ncbi:hypothetical protein V8E36_009692 [Tilletia maclaganii]
MPSRPPFRPAPSLKPAEAAAKAAATNRTLSHILPSYVSRLPPPLPLTETVIALRRNHKFAAVCQFLFTFGDTVLVGEEWSTKALEDALDGKDSSYVPRICIKLLQTLTFNRNIDTSNYIRTIQTQAEKRAVRQLPISDTLKPRPPLGSDPFPTLPSLVKDVPPAPLSTAHDATSAVDAGHSAAGPALEGSAAAPGTEDSAVAAAPPAAAPVPLITDITTLPPAAQVDVLHTLCEWHMLDPDRLRKLMKSEEDPQSWRIDPIGWDAQDNTYFLFDDNRLWIQRARPWKPRPVVQKPKMTVKTTKTAAKPYQGKPRGRPRKNAKADAGKGRSTALAANKKRPRGSAGAAAESDDDEEYDDDAEEPNARGPSAKKRGVAAGSGRARAVPSTPKQAAGRRGRRTAADELEHSPSTSASPSTMSGPRKLRTRNGPPPPYAYQTGLAPVPAARGIRASSRIRGGGVGTSGPFNEDGWQRIPEALMELDESIRKEDEQKRGRRRSSRSARDEDEDFKEDGEEEQDDVAKEGSEGLEEASEGQSGGQTNGEARADAKHADQDAQDAAKTTESPAAPAAEADIDLEEAAGPAAAEMGNAPEEVKKTDSSDSEDDDLSELSDLSDVSELDGPEQEEAADEDGEDEDDDDGSLTPIEDFEHDEDDFEPVAADFVEFEAICVTKEEWQAFGTRFAKSKNKNEKALHAVVNDTILPRILEDFAEEERQRALEIVMASRKRSSRIATRESEREERERLEAAAAEQEAKMNRLREEEEARVAKERAEIEAAVAREERIREREERLAAREREIIVRMGREEAERIKAETERELRVARRKAMANTSRDNSMSRDTSVDPGNSSLAVEAEANSSSSNGVHVNGAANGAVGGPSTVPVTTATKLSPPATLPPKAPLPAPQPNGGTAMVPPPSTYAAPVAQEQSGPKQSLPLPAVENTAHAVPPWTQAPNPQPTGAISASTSFATQPAQIASVAAPPPPPAAPAAVSSTHFPSIAAASATGHPPGPDPRSAPPQ